LCGREFEVVDFRQSWGNNWVYFYDDKGELRAIRTRWTDWEEEDPFVAIAAGRALFRIDDLLRLVVLLEGLEEQPARKDRKGGK
jgi:hypothetical protein